MIHLRKQFFSDNQDNFFENYNYNLNLRIKLDIKKIWEKKDQEIFESKFYQEKNYKVKSFEKRTILTIYGPISFKRRRYKYWDNKSNKYRYICLADKFIGIKPRERIITHLKLKILKYIADGKRQKDILDCFPNFYLTTRTISTIIRSFDAKLFDEVNVKKININKYLHISIDETFINLRENKKLIKYRGRIVSFATESTKFKNRYTLKNKRVFIMMIPKNMTVNNEEFFDQIKKIGNKFYNNFNNSIKIVYGDGAKWIRKIAKMSNAKFVLDKFHAFRKLWRVVMKKNNQLYKNKYKEIIKYFNESKIDKIIQLLQEEKNNATRKCWKIKYQKVIQYFINNAQGVLNQENKANIKTSIEGDISHLIKSTLGYGSKIFNVKTFQNMITARISKLNGINVDQVLKKYFYEKLK